MISKLYNKFTFDRVFSCYAALLQDDFQVLHCHMFPYV
jgi:hypothetical protein